MRIKITSLLIALFASLNLLAQAPPSVPSEMEFAGVKLKITEAAKQEISETLDLLIRSQYHFQLKADRSNLYMHIVERVLKEEGIPEDFKYLAIQEGEFIADAVSTSNAVGFWQFKKASAQELGLRVDNVVDERKHIVLSTIGATKYFKRSNFVFDNWVLSLQSYLQGLTGTQRSVPEKWYGAKRMEVNKKTHWYIKKFLAHKLAFQDFVGEGRKHPEVQLDEFEARGSTLRQVSQQLNIDYEELKRFNVWLISSRIPNDKSYEVIYPVKKGGPVARNNSRSRRNNQTEPEAKPESTGNTNSGRPEKKESIVDKLFKRSNARRPLEGNTGLFPVITGNLSAEYEPGNIKLNNIPAIRARSGENVNSLASRTGLSVLKLKLFNDIGTNGNVRSGKYYYLKKKKGKGKVHYHVVQPGETIWGISQQYGIRLKKLLHKNRMRKEEPLKVGRVMWLRFIRPSNVPVEYVNVRVASNTLPAEDRLIEEVKPAEEKREKPIAKSEEPKPVEQPPAKEEVERSKEGFDPVDDAAPPVVVIERKPLKPGPNEEVITHIVKPKESFFAISRLYQLDIDDILAWNGLRIQDGLQIDQELQLVVKKKPAIKTQEIPEKAEESVTHEVKKGDTLWSISREYGVTVEEILKWNKKSSDSLALGEKLRILKKK